MDNLSKVLKRRRLLSPALATSQFQCRAHVLWDETAAASAAGNSHALPAGPSFLYIWSFVFMALATKCENERDQGCCARCIRQNRKAACFLRTKAVFNNFKRALIAFAYRKVSAGGTINLPCGTDARHL